MMQIKTKPMKKPLLAMGLICLATTFPTQVKASLTLIHWYNQTGRGTDTAAYHDPAMRGRFKGEALYKNDNDPCIYEQKNIQKKGGEIVRGKDKFCTTKEESMRNPVMKFGGITIPGDWKRRQSPVAEPMCAVKKWASQGKQLGICP